MKTIQSQDMKVDDRILFEGHVYRIVREAGVNNGTISPTLERLT